MAVTLDFTIEKVKSIATEHFYGHDKNKSPSQFRLVHGIMLKPLEDEKTLGEEKISESGKLFSFTELQFQLKIFNINSIKKFITDELLLVEVRSGPEKETMTEDELKGPTEDQIMEATKDLPVRNPPKPAINSNCPTDVNFKHVFRLKFYL